MLSRYRETVRVWTDPIGRQLFRLHLRPNHLTLIGFGVSLLAATAFVFEQNRTAGFLLLMAGLCDFFDGSLARVSGQVTPFGGFLDSVIDRYSDLVVLLGIVVLFARMPHARGALVAMAGLVGSVMVSYTRARAASIGVDCNVGFMERPERMICLIAGAVLNLLEPALWILAILANLTALHRIAFTRRATREAEILKTLACAAVLLVPAAARGDPNMGGPNMAPHTPQTLGAPRPSCGASRYSDVGLETWGAPKGPPMPPDARKRPGEGVALLDTVHSNRLVAGVTREHERAWAHAVEQYQQGDSGPLIREFSAEAALRSPIGDYVRYVLGDGLARRGELARARALTSSIAEHSRDSRLAPAGLLLAATLAARSGDDASSQTFLTKLIESYPDSRELPEALYLLGMIGEARGRLPAAALAYRELTVLVPASGWADGALDRLAVLARAGIQVPQLSLAQRIDRAERLLRDGVPKTAGEEAERIAGEARDPSIVLRALRVVADAAQKLGRYEVAARALEIAIDRAPRDRKPALQLEEARLLAKTKKREKALMIFATVVATGSEGEAAEAAYQRARLLDDLGRAAEATVAYRAVAARYPSREVAGASLWRLGWLAYLRRDTRGAGEAWDRLAEVPGGRVYRAAAFYWAGRARETSQGKAAAEKLYARVLAESPRSYYGVLAARRVAAPIAGNHHPAINLPDDPGEAIADDPGYARVDLLRRIGLVEYAWQELEDVVQRSVADPVRLYGLSSAYVKDERYHLALRILRRHFAALATTGDAALPQAFWEMLYPFGWRAAVTEAAEREGLDPFLVAAIVREESSYYPRAISRAGARGLMQLMPGTAQLIAEPGVAIAGGEGLDDPNLNVRLGTRFLAGMLKEFRDPRLALAGYNAGPSRVHQWWKARRTDDVDAFVEQIPFDETRQYVKRVMLSWEEYRRIYGRR